MPGIGLLVFDDFQIMGLAALSAFEMANAALERPAYRVHVLSEAGGAVRNSLGFDIQTQPFTAEVHDTTIAIGSYVVKPSSPGFLAYLGRAAEGARRVAGICTGAYVLAEAGLLDGRRATTHWAHVAELQARYPQVKVEADPIFVVDGKIWTSAGMSAGIDLALAMVEEDFGREIARATARRLVLYLRRSGGQSQFSTLLEMEPKTDRIRRALIHAKEHLTGDLSVEELAEAARLSTRQFSRLFRSETGQSPAKAIATLRLEAARALMEEGVLSLEEIARATGFAGRERMRRAFLRAFGQPPQLLRGALAQGRREWAAGGRAADGGLS